MSETEIIRDSNVTGSITAGSVVEGKVVKIKPFGAVVLLPNKSQGLVHISHISNKYVQDVNDFLAIGDTVTVKVLSVDSDGGKISLSIKETEPPQPKRPERSQHFREDESSSLPISEIYPYTPSNNSGATFEEKFKDWLKVSNERHAGLNKRNKRKY